MGALADLYEEDKKRWQKQGNLKSSESSRTGQDFSFGGGSALQDLYEQDMQGFEERRERERIQKELERPRKEYEAKIKEFDTKLGEAKEERNILQKVFRSPTKKEKELTGQRAEFVAATFNKKYTPEEKSAILAQKPKDIKLSDEQYISLRESVDNQLKYLNTVKSITTQVEEELNNFQQWQVKQNFNGEETVRNVPFLPTKELVAQSNTYNIQTDWTQAYDYLRKAAKESGMSEEEYARSYNANVSQKMAGLYEKVIGKPNSLTKEQIAETTKRTGIPAVDDNQIRVEIENINQYLDTAKNIYDEYTGVKEVEKVDNIKEGLKVTRDKILSGTAPFVGDLFNSKQEGFLDIAQLKQLEDKLANGEKLTTAETARIVLTSALETNQQIDRGWKTRVAEGTPESLKMMGEMAATYGIFTGTTTAVKTAQTAISKKISYSAAKEIVEAAAQETGKSWIRTLATNGAKEGLKQIMGGVATAMVAEIPETIAKDTLKIATEVMDNNRPIISFSDPETEKEFISLIENDEEYNSDWVNNLTKAFARQYFNNALERGGGEIPDAIIAEGADKLKGLVIAKYISQRGIQTLEEFQKVYDAMGLQGMFGEVFEEYAQDYTEALIDGRDFVIDDPDKFWDIVAQVGVLQLGKAGSVATTTIDVTKNLITGQTFEVKQGLPPAQGEVPPVDTQVNKDLDTLVNTQTQEAVQDDLQTKEIIRQQQVSGETPTIPTEQVDNTTLLTKAQALFEISKQTEYSLASLTELKKLERQATDEKTAQAIASISDSYAGVLAQKVAEGSVNIGQQVNEQLQEATKEITPEGRIQEGVKIPKQEVLKTPNKEYYIQEKGKFKEIKNAQAIKIMNEADTFIYRDPESKLYQVVEARSGMALSEASTRNAAIKQARERLNKMGIESFQNKIQEAINKRGVSPRYIKKETKSVKKGTKKADKTQDKGQPESLQEQSPIEKAGLKIGSKIKVQGKLREISEFGKSARDSQGILVRFTDGTYITLDKAQEYAAQKQTKVAIKKESVQKTKEAVKKAEEAAKEIEKGKKVDQNQLAKRRMDIGKTNKEVRAITKDLKDFQESEDYKALKEEYKILLKEARFTHSTLESYIDNMINIYGEEAATYLEDFMQRWTAAQEIIDTFTDQKTRMINDQLRAEGFEIPKYRKIKNDKLSSKTPFVITNEVSNIVKKYKSSIELEKDYMILYHGGQKEIIGGKLVTGGRIAGDTTEENLGRGTDMGGIFFTPEKDFASIFTRWSEAGAGKVHTFLVKTKEMFDVRNPQHYQKLKDFVGKTYKDIDGEDLVFTEQMLNFMVNDGIMDWATFDSSVIEALGFKGVVVTENSDYDNGKPLMTYVLFEGGRDSDHYLIPDQIERISDLYKEVKEGIQININHGGVLNPLITFHNITGENLLLADKAGGLIAPSVAVSKPTNVPDGFGEITLVGGRELADPEIDYRNKLYSHDVYSPKVTRPSYDTDIDGLEKFFYEDRDVVDAFDEMDADAYGIIEEAGSDQAKENFFYAAEKSIGLMNYYAKQNGIKMPTVNYYVKATGENTVDVIGTREAFRKKYREQYEQWIRDSFDEYFGEPYVIIKGKKLPYTAENIVESMFGKGIRGQEGGMFTGLNKIKGLGAKDYKTIEQAKRDGYGRLVSEKEYEEITKKQYDDFSKYQDKLQKYSRFGQEGYSSILDHNLEYAMSDYAKKSRTMNSFTSAFSRNGYDLPKDVAEETKKWADGILSDPVPYLEGKLRRVVNIGDFEGALVPDMYREKSPEIEQILRKNGVKKIIWLTGENIDLESKGKLVNENFDDIKYRMSSGLDTILTQEQIDEIDKYNQKFFGDTKYNILQELLSEDGQKVYGRYLQGWIDIIETDAKNNYLHEAAHKGFARSDLNKKVVLDEIIKKVGKKELEKKWGNYPNESLAKYLYETNRREGHRGYDEITSMADIRRNLDILRKDKQRKLTKDDKLVEEAKGWLLLSDKEVSELNEYDREDYNKYLKPQLEAIAIDGLDDGEVVVIKGGTDGRWVDTDIKVALNRGVSSNTLALIVKETEIESTGVEAKDDRGERLLAYNIFEESEYAPAEARYRGSIYGDDVYIWAEEELAENFIDYVQGRETFTGQIKQFFDDLLEFIKSLIGAESQVKKLYREIYTGKLSTKQMDNIQKQYVTKYRADLLFDEEVEEETPKKPKKQATLEITKTPEAGVVYDVKGSSILPSRKLQQQIEETLMSGQSTPATRSVTAFMPVIETAGKIKDSRAFEKIQDRYAEIQELDPSLNELKYQSMSIADITAKAMAFVDEYPAEARRVALGMELAPEGTTNIAVSLAYTEKMFEEGKWKQAREADRALSLRGTRLGQEIVSFKGRLNANSPMFFMEQVLNARRMVVSSRIFKSGSLENFAKMKQERMAEVAKTLKQIKLEKAEDFINKLIC